MFAKLKEAAKTAAKEVGTVAEKAAKDIVDSEQTQKVLRDLSEKTQQAKDIVESEQTQKVFRDLSKKTQHLTTELQHHQAAATTTTTAVVDGGGGGGGGGGVQDVVKNIKKNFGTDHQLQTNTTASKSNTNNNILWCDGEERQISNVRVFRKDDSVIPVSSIKSTTAISSSSSSSSSLNDTNANEKEEEEEITVQHGTSSRRSINDDDANGRSSSTASFKHDHDLKKEKQKQKAQVHLPILLIPGLCSSGLYVEQSGLDNKKYQGRRVWMNAGFIAQSAANSGKKVYIDVDTGSSTSTTLPTDTHTTTSSTRTTTTHHVDAHPSSSSSSSSIIKNNNNSITDEEEEKKKEKEVVVENIIDCSNDTSTSSIPNTTREEEVEREKEEEQQQEKVQEFAKCEEYNEIRSAWLYHISLDTNMIDERPGNRIRTYDGIEGCEWIVDGAFEKPQARIWYDVIKFLETDPELKYCRGKNIDAVPYDWRLPPRHLEERDGYFTKTMERVESMYKDNDDLPIILACHSMGCKIGHYFLNFCQQKKGRAWIDRHIHCYMPIGAPHAGAPLSVKMGATGGGLAAVVEDVLLSLDECLIMYRSWGSGPYFMPRELPKDAFPAAIVRREGELGIKIISDIDVGDLFADRDKPPKELRLTMVYRSKIRASTEYVPLKIIDDESTNPPSMILSFNETFYLAIPHVDNDDNLGSLVFYLEEPFGRFYEDTPSEFREKFKKNTQWARGFKKAVAKVSRNVAKKIGMPLRVAVCKRPLALKISMFEDRLSQNLLENDDAEMVMEADIPFCRCSGNHNAQKIMDEIDNDENEEEEESEYYASSMSLHSIADPSFGSLEIFLSYNPHPDVTNESQCTTKFSVGGIDHPIPVVSRRRKYNTINHTKIKYESWHGRDLIHQDGFMETMFKINEEYYENDPLGPTTKSALDAPPVNIVHSIYGINVPTEVSAVYRKRPVVTIGDGVADSRYMIDKSASFQMSYDNFNADAKAILSNYELKDGIINEFSETPQTVPGMTEKRKCSGDGTVPYWSLVHCLSWKDTVPKITVDELEGAVHRDTITDKRFLALLKQYCTVDDPR